MQELSDFIESLENSAQLVSAGALAKHMLIGGLLALLVRALYRRFGLTVSNRDTFSNIFPLLTIATVLIIFVVKSSLALSLGLVGALSIVRFRAAIKEPEEIVFLFFCIALGLALGAERYELAVGGIVIFTGFVLLRHYSRRKSDAPAMLLTIAGEEKDVLDGDENRITSAVAEVVGSFTVQRLEVDEGEVQFRAVVAPGDAGEVSAMTAGLRKRLPGCRISYVNLANLV